MLLVLTGDGSRFVCLMLTGTVDATFHAHCLPLSDRPVVSPALVISFPYRRGLLGHSPESHFLGAPCSPSCTGSSSAGDTSSSTRCRPSLGSCLMSHCSHGRRTCSRARFALCSRAHLWRSGGLRSYLCMFFRFRVVASPLFFVVNSCALSPNYIAAAASTLAHVFHGSSVYQ